MSGRAPASAIATVCILAATTAVTAQRQGAGPYSKQRVSFTTDGLTLVGFLFKPAGAGPFPALIWNHGSEQSPGVGPQFDTVAGIFVPAGYVVFAPVRRGHGLSEGMYIGDQVQRARQLQGALAAQQLLVHLHETEQLDDQLAGLDYVKRLPYVDTNRLVVAGCSYGGIQTLLAAERGAGFKAAIAISPAAESWNGNRFLQDRLVRAVRNVDMPVMILQPPKDASLEPIRVLGAELTRAGKRHVDKIYPATGPLDEQMHCFGGAKGMHVWAADAVAFLGDVIH